MRQSILATLMSSMTPLTRTAPCPHRHRPCSHRHPRSYLVRSIAASVPTGFGRIVPRFDLHD
eukprot:16428216-Heterocapsa_arctica.AAC.1